MGFGRPNRGEDDERELVEIGWGKMHFMQWKIIGSKWAMVKNKWRKEGARKSKSAAGPMFSTYSTDEHRVRKWRTVEIVYTVKA